MENGAPLLLRQKIDEKFHVEEARGVGAVVGPADLIDDLRNFRETSRESARARSATASAFRGPGARRQRPANPNRAFIQMRQKFRADHAAEGQRTSRARKQATAAPTVRGRCRTAQ